MTNDDSVDETRSVSLAHKSFALVNVYPLPTAFLVRWCGLRYSLRKGA